MAVASGIFIYLLTWLLGWVTAIFDSSDMEGDERLKVPGNGYSDDEIAGALHVLARSAKINVEMPNLKTYVSDVHKLYYDPRIRTQDYNKYQSEHVHFHNWDHGCNVWSLSHWYGDQQSNGLSNQEKFLLEIAALSHDVMHPGTPNTEEYVQGSFLQHVNRWRTATGVSPNRQSSSQSSDAWTLDDFAQNLRDQTQLTETSIRHVLGCDESRDKNIDNVLKQRAPQEVLHSWITMILLKKHLNVVFSEKAQLKTVVKAILMTSITAHFKVLFSPNGQEKLQAHVTDTTEDKPPKEGLLFHLFDMGYLCETGMGEGADKQNGLVFAARYLIESGNLPQGLANWGKVQESQIFFAGSVVKPYLRNFNMTNKFHAPLVQELMKGVVEFEKNIRNDGLLRGIVETEASNLVNATPVLNRTSALKNAGEIKNWQD